MPPCVSASDSINQALTKRGPGAAQSLSAHVHEFSTSVANAQLLAALLHGRDIIMDGTMTWREYAAQTLAMVRKIHQFTYRIGAGYHKEADGTVVERYWELDSPRPQASCFQPYYIQVKERDERQRTRKWIGSVSHLTSSPHV